MATFHRFSHLPIELRYRIWRASIPDTGRVVLLLTEARPYHEKLEKADLLSTRASLHPPAAAAAAAAADDVFIEYPAGKTPACCIRYTCHEAVSALGTTLTMYPPAPPKRVSCPIPVSLNLPTLYTCHEARSAILKPETTLTMYPPGPFRPVSVYFNYELDTLFDPRFEDSHYCRLNPRYRTVIKAEDRKKVQHVMVDVNLEKPWHFKNRRNESEHSVGPNKYRDQYACSGPQRIYSNLRSFTVHINSPLLAQSVKDQDVFRWSGFHVGRIAELGKRFEFRFSIPEDDRNKWTERDGDLFISWSSKWKDLGRDLECALVLMTKGDIEQQDRKNHKVERRDFHRYGQNSTDPVRFPSANS